LQTLDLINLFDFTFRTLYTTPIDVSHHVLAQIDPNKLSCFGKAARQPSAGTGLQPLSGIQHQPKAGEQLSQNNSTCWGLFWLKHGDWPHTVYAVTNLTK